MDKFTLSDEQSIADFNAFILEDKPKEVGIIGLENSFSIRFDNGMEVEIPRNKALDTEIDKIEPKYDPVLYGKNGLEGIVAAEVDGDNLILFLNSGEKLYLPNKTWVCATKNHNDKFDRLDGDRSYKFMKVYQDSEKWKEVMRDRYKFDLFGSYCPVESNLILSGFTFFKGTEIKDVAILAFDIETNGLVHNSESDVYLITNSIRKNGVTTSKTFDIHEYCDAGEMIQDWCKWVREVDPSIMVGHNIYTYDLPWLRHVAGIHGIQLNLGRDHSPLWFTERESKFRKEGKQFIHYFKPNIFGRQVIDGMFLAIKYDAATRKYDSYGLKPIIKAEGLEKPGRVFVDAGRLKSYLNDPEMWKLVRDYADADSEDSLKLFDLMAPSYFYFNQMVPKTFEAVINGASGSQLNAMLLRAYLQNGESVPKANERKNFQGAISHGVPGIYRNVWKVDVNAEYPSIIRQFKLFNKKKDPKGYYLEITEKLTIERLKNKELGKTNKYYYDLEQSAKIAINSLYGLTNTNGLNFNDPDMGEFITKTGRDIVNSACVWATSKTAEEWGWSPKPLEEDDE